VYAARHTLIEKKGLEKETVLIGNVAAIHCLAEGFSEPTEAPMCPVGRTASEDPE
jgi:hypothetical protein